MATTTPYRTNVGERMINWTVFTNSMIIGMVFTNNFLVWKRFYRLRSRLEKLERGSHR